MNNKDRAAFEALVKKNGIEHQVIVAIGELAELQQELAKYLRKIGSVKQICDEMADVEICMDQLRVIFDSMDRRVPLHRHFKIARMIEYYLRGEEL